MSNIPRREIEVKDALGNSLFIVQMENVLGAWELDEAHAHIESLDHWVDVTDIVKNSDYYMELIYKAMDSRRENMAERGADNE